MVIVCTLFDVFAAVLNQSYREARAPCFSGVVFFDKSSKSRTFRIHLRSLQNDFESETELARKRCGVRNNN